MSILKICLLIFCLFLAPLSYSQTQTFENYFRAGLKKMELGDIEGAIVEFTIAVEIEPKQIGFLHLADAKQKIGDFAGALGVYDEIVKEDSSDAEVFNNRGNLKDQLLQSEEAILEYNRAIELDSSYTLAYFNRALAFYNLKKYAEAKQDFLVVLTEGPQDAEVLLGLGLTEYRLNNREASCDYLKKAQALEHPMADKYLKKYCSEAEKKVEEENKP